MVNPVFLRSFCTLVETGHFTRTAERLFMTQSGVSQHIHKLESQLATPLLIRQGKQFTLTEAGERLYRESLSILKALSELEVQVGNDPEFEGVVRVVSPGSIGLKLYKQLLSLQQQHPQLVIDYRFAPNHEVERLIADNKVDLGFMTCRPTRRDVQIQTLAQEELLLVTGKQTPHVNWQDLQRLGFIDHPDGAHHAALLLGVNFAEYEQGQAFRHSGFCNQISLILEPVSLGLGFSVLPRHAVEAYSGLDKLCIHQLVTKVYEPIYSATYLNKVLTNRVKTVLKAAEQCLK